MEHLTTNDIVKCLNDDNKINYYKFMKHIDIRGSVRNDMSPCWRWINASFSSSGYGQITFNYKLWNAHRYSYYIHNGCKDLEKGKHICHRCDNKECANPDHLYIGTAKDNSKDTWERGLKKRKEKKPVKKGNYLTPHHLIDKDTTGDKNTNAKLTWDIVNHIRNKYSEGLPYGGLKALAVEYNIAYNTIQKIVANQTWTR